MANSRTLKEFVKKTLHKELRVPAGKKIPEQKLKEAIHSKNPTTGINATYALRNKIK